MLLIFLKKKWTFGLKHIFLIINTIRSPLFSPLFRNHKIFAKSTNDYPLASPLFQSSFQKSGLKVD